ncbi:hypothetical protein [Nocardia sp. N2S4-5]|uniref:hypothetical protein n=1 Tax=Nocardia sp. N2S4-5 TaxID=3351565 RepID=UPI0037D1CE2A
MTAVITALIAVAGTLLGSTATFLIQRSTAARGAADSFAEQLRRDRLEAFHAVSVAATKFRHGQIERWYLIQEGDPDAEALQAAKRHCYQLRTDLRDALLKVELVIDDPRLQELGVAVIDAIRQIHRATTLSEHVECTTKASNAIRAFVKHASMQIQTPPEIRRRQLTGDAGRQVLSPAAD